MYKQQNNKLNYYTNSFQEQITEPTSSQNSYLALEQQLESPGQQLESLGQQLESVVQQLGQVGHHQKTQFPLATASIIASTLLR